MLGQNSTYKSSLCSHDHGCVAFAVWDQWYHIVPTGRWEELTAHGLLGCALGLAGFCTEKLLTAHSESVREITLICSDIIRICFHHVPAGQLQVSEIKKENHCQHQFPYRQNWDNHLAACSSAVPKGCHSDFEVTESLLCGLTERGLVWSKVFGE